MRQAWCTSSRDGKVVVMPPELKKRHAAARHCKEQCLAVSMCGKFTAVHSTWAVAARVYVQLGTPTGSTNVPHHAASLVGRDRGGLNMQGERLRGTAGSKLPVAQENGVLISPLCIFMNPQHQKDVDVLEWGQRRPRR